MKKDKRNVDYKKLTVEIPMTTFIEMDLYCHGTVPSLKDMFYCDFVDLAIKYYIDNHI